MYDPTVGRFTTKDPSEFVGGDENLYRYVHNSPTNATDPTGLLEYKLNTVPKSKKEGMRGGFEVVVDWYISPRPKATRWVIQEVNAYFNVEYCEDGKTWKPLDDKRNKNWHYWEAWKVEAGSDSPSSNRWNVFKGDDSFHIPDGQFEVQVASQKAKRLQLVKTRGIIKLTGDVEFYDFYNLPGGTSSWPHPNSSTNAGSLPAITQWPAGPVFVPTIHRVAIAKWGYDGSERTDLTYTVTTDIPNNMGDSGTLA